MRAPRRRASSRAAWVSAWPSPRPRSRVATASTDHHAIIWDLSSDRRVVLAGHKNKGNLDKKIENLNERIGEVVVFGGSVGGTEERRNQIDKLEQKLGYALFKRNQKDD